MRQRVASVPRFLLFSLALTCALLIAAAVTTRFGETPRIVQAAVPGLGNLSGAVQAPTTFKAAQVLIRNVDKHILYMATTTLSASNCWSPATTRNRSPSRDRRSTRRPERTGSRKCCA